MGNELQHRTVLLDEAVESLVTRPDGTYVDGTFGRGGHSRAVLARLAPAGRLIAFDKDPRAIETAQRIEDARFSIVHDSFASMRDALAARGIERCRGVAGPGRVLATGGRSGARFQLSRGWSAGHADGSDAWRVGGRVACTGFGAGIDGGDTGLWGRTVCFSDCKGACCSPGRVRPSWASRHHGRACPNRGSRRQNP